MKPRVLIFAAAVALTLTGCTIDRPAPERNSEGSVETSQAVDPFDLEVGDCTADIPEGDVLESIVIPCDEPHYWEIYDGTELTGDDYPDDSTTTADEYCYNAFTEFMGLPYEESEYEITYMYPTAETWAEGDREILCLTGTGEGGLTGTLKGAAA
jgi:hypothetical protein